MPQFVKVASAAELPPPGNVKEFQAGDRTICVANVNGRISAIDNVCLHVGGPLGQGTIENGKVVCPWHGWEYDAQTGALAHNAGIKVAVYPLKVENDEVWVEL